MDRTQRVVELPRPPENSVAIPAREVILDRERVSERRVVFPESTGPAAHAYRLLRTQLLRQVRQHKLRMIGVVTPVDGEGKTLTATNLALSMAAEPNQTVLLADLDLHRPTIASLLGIDCKQGLEAWFAGTAHVGELFVRLQGIERLRVLPTLAPVAGSSEALAGSRAHELLEELKNHYPDRLVILDLPPILLTDDLLTISPLIDGVLIVLREGITQREDVTRVRELLNNVRILGTVLNDSEESEKRTY